MGLEGIVYSIKANELGPVVVIEDQSGRYEPMQGISKSKILEYGIKLSELWKSAQIGEKTLNQFKSTYSRLTIRADTETLSELMIKSIALIISRGCKAVKEESPLLSSYKAALQDARTGEMVRQLGTDYSTAASKCKDRNYLDNLIREISDDIGSDGIFTVNFLHQAYPVQDVKKEERSSSRFKRKTGRGRFTGSIDELRKSLMKERGYAGGESDTHPGGLVLEPTADSSQEAPQEIWPGVVEPNSEKTLVIKKPEPKPTEESIHEGKTPKQIDISDVQEAARGLKAKASKPDETTKMGPVKELPETEIAYSMQPPTDIIPKQAEPNLVQRVEEQQPEAVKPAEPPETKQPTSPEPDYSEQLPKETPPEKEQVEEKKESSFLKKVAIAVTLLGVLYGTAVGVHAGVPSSRKYLSSQYLSYLGKAIEESSSWVRETVDSIRKD